MTGYYTAVVKSHVHLLRNCALCNNHCSLGKEPFEIVFAYILLVKRRSHCSLTSGPLFVHYNHIKFLQITTKLFFILRDTDRCWFFIYIIKRNEYLIIHSNCELSYET